MSNLVEHAKSELRIIGYTGEEPEDDPNKWMWDGVIEVVEKFAAQGHSGSSAAYALGVIQKVLNFENVTPLTNDPVTWGEVGMGAGDDVWQSRRRSDAFSHDGGITYYLLDDPKLPKWKRPFIKNVHGMRLHTSEVA